MTTPALTIAILAGGAATRLGGRDKGLEILAGKPMIEWVIAACPRDAELVVIANRHLDEYARYGRVATDAEAGFRGPLAGVASALAAATTSHVLTLPVDCPDPPADLEQRLAAVDAIAAVAHDGERRQPLFALYRTGLAEAAAAGAKAGRGVWEWQETIGAVEVDFADERRQFHNFNTPEEFAAYADVFRSLD
ncbi:MAG TPA: molybdenum cofactor guanylyltransferase MobA [Rhodanobacteraceae bacterium]|jgi:molybdopterin-guanine dinucleotide biosynthesis protein A|nr:molybdenum cofactor guanylyltransferase MobA [Rhodanobacteraceae bacterium]